ncbi:Inositol-1-4-5-trisphosphate 5-phosphatase 1 [Penicillium subrubescens]|uniref:phosphoinositide 5-phosphatase n=1 Tax=Penicillium subrubescens TaxID=1316194 RepID=A0A1Q5SME2_9EURO|nr:Inositol-1-4-5-trisphosphate 5-phosphatase 1 [Penicillium subrubescens]KAJ5875527.1 Inositol-1-4-5-trisphosphate 5-phosphatase 1 [Penicillium subrubescens]OKO89187.1 Inositol-1,4,5-trisphosphate 5-phosphatase 1 [Penicillium subrubescens]
MFNLRVLCQDQPRRTIALLASDHVLIFHYNEAEGGPRAAPRCQVEFLEASSVDLAGYRSLGAGYGTLGLVTLNEDVFVCVVTGSSQAATVRPAEAVSRIDNVDFYCLNRSEYEYGLDYETSSQFAVDERPGTDGKEVVTDHPFLALKKLLGDGSFYYSLDFNLTDRLQDRSEKSAAFDIDSLDEDMLWNSYMIHPLLLFRSHLPPYDKAKLDASQMLTCVIRGYAGTLKIPATVSILPKVRTNLPALLTIISRQSSRRAGTRFNSRGIDDDGNVANFVETEIVLWVSPGICFSYVQIRGSVPIFWEQTPGLIPGQQKIEVTRSFEATQHAFNQHFESLELEYGAVHIVNLLSELKSGEADLSAKFREHIARSSVRQKEGFPRSPHQSLLRMTDYDFHAETRGPAGYEASHQIKYELADSLDGFAYFLSEDSTRPASSILDREDAASTSSILLQQEGVFRTNCLDCLDRTNLVQTIISAMALGAFLSQQGARLSSDLQMRHSTLWADNGDALSKIYAGTGALKSSFTRTGKMSLAGALADARKSATRLYVNNFTDKARQKTIDLLLGRLANQIPVHLYDPMNDLVTEDLSRRAAEYSSSRKIRMWVGTFNVNGRDEGPGADLSSWLFPDGDHSKEDPTIFAVGFQEIVDLSPQQIMSTDPSNRKGWERAVQNCLNEHTSARGTGKYVLLRSGQLVGAALMIYVKADALKEIKNVEGAVKKTGLSGIAGNKGGCAIRFDFSNTSICFVTAHLAAGFGNDDERDRDYETIDRGLRFQKNRTIADHDSTIWLGDFNYRIGLGNHIVRDLVSQGDLQKLYDNDQLNLHMGAGRVFQFYSEGLITFPPTYKYDVGTDHYDTSDKSRIPAWCDRILWRGANLRQTQYHTADLRCSDHRPVYAKFDCIIDIVDIALKDNLRRLLYEEKQRDALSDTINLLDMDDEDSAPQDPIAPGLPPASSDRSKWWLDNGVAAKAAVQPPKAGLVPNPQRKSNPFSMDDEPDWIPGSRDTDQGPDARVDRRPLPPPRRGTSGRSKDNMQSPGGDAPVVEKSPPAVPRKPVSLSSQATAGRIPSGSSSQERSASLQGSPSLRQTADGGRGVSSAETGDLLGDASGEPIGWKPLLPQR